MIEKNLFDFCGYGNYRVKVSIIVPVYNAEKYIVKCVSSIKNQSYEDIEVIIVDDGSTDASYELAKFAIDNDLRFRLIRQNNMGVSVARNNALKISTGEYIAFVDSDDWIEKEYIEVLLNNAYEHNVKISCSAMCFDLNGITERPHIFEDKTVEAIEALDFKSKYYLTGIGGKLFHKSLFDKCSFLPQITLSEDTYLYMVFVDQEGKVFWTNRSMYHYFMNDSSATHSRNAQHNFSDFQVRVRILEIYKKYPTLIKGAIDYATTSALKVKLYSLTSCIQKSDIQKVNKWIIENRKNYLKSNNIGLKNKVAMILLSMLCVRR